MKTFKKVIALVLTFAIAMSMGIAGTVAYLQDDDSDINVMTLGNVQIEQIEQEWNDDKTELIDFTQAKPLYPFVGTLGWENTADGGAYRRFTMNNVVDKYVSVKNTGKSDAYVRTVFAFEMGEFDNVDDFYYNVIGTSTNAANGNEFQFEGAWLWGEKFVVELDGQNYMIWEAVHQDVLKPEKATIPSLLQVYMSSAATNEDVAKVDGNKNGTYDILVLSQAVQVDGFANAKTALNTAFGETNEANVKSWFDGDEFTVPTVVATAEELATALKSAGAPKSGNTTIILSENVDMTDIDWAPVFVSGYQGAGVVTFDGAGHTITGLDAPLFAGGFAGKSGIIIRNLTIADSTIKSNNTQGSAAFIECVDSMETIILENCHLVDSTVDAPEARTGGLVGWTSGYSNQNDGPVKTYVTIKDCSVVGCTITGTSVGGVTGHAGASDWTYTTIENCRVLNNKLESTDDGSWRVGAILGTANVGEVVIKGCDIGGNTMTMPQSTATIADAYCEEVGRFVPGSTGKLEINGTSHVALAENNAAIDDAIKGGYTNIELPSGNFIIPDSAKGKTLTFTGTGDTVVATQDDGSYEGCDYSLDGATATFENITINTDSSTYTGYARMNGTYNNCTINGTYTLYGDSVFNNCTFKVSGDVYNIWTWGAPTATFNNCTFISDGKALLLYGTVNTKLTLNNCTFEDKGGLTDLKAAIEIGNDYNKSYELIVNNTKVNGYEINNKGINTGTTLWGNKDSMGTDKLNVVVDGVDVY